MIIYPADWKDCVFPYYGTADKQGAKKCAEDLLSILSVVVGGMDIKHLLLSGGIDSTLMLATMTKELGSGIRTYTISCRTDHPDIIFARRASKVFGSDHTEIIVEPEPLGENDHTGDNAIRQMFEVVAGHTDKCVTCDGIDELLCGYYDHLVTDMNMRVATYIHYLSRLVPDHLVPLDLNSADVGVYLPFLDNQVVEYLTSIPLSDKLEGDVRKAITVEAARMLRVPNEIISRNKYGFCDAFLAVDKKEG